MAKVMLVEDDNNLREIYEARLQAEGYTLVSAKDGEEALVVAKAEKPDLIISDVMMPKISGFEMLDILRNTDGLKDVKVIMLTALGQSDDQQRADKLGADRYLVKSQVTLEDIVDVTRKLLADDGVAAPTPAADSPIAPAVEPASPPPVIDMAAAPEPPSASTAVPVSEPAVDDAATPAAVADSVVPEPAAPVASAEENVQSSQEEQAGMEAQIENFVAGATSEATPAAAPPSSPAPEAPTVTTPQPVAIPVAEPVDSETTTGDDTLRANATDTPVTDTQPAVTPDTQPGVPSVEPTVETSAPLEESTGGTRIITPLDAKPKPDINALLAAEAAKEGAPTPPPSANVQPDKPVDPNSIAL